MRDIQIALGLVAAGEGITLVPDSLKPSVPSKFIIIVYATKMRQPWFLWMYWAHQSNRYIDDLLQATYQVYEAKGITYSNQSLN